MKATPRKSVRWSFEPFLDLFFPRRCLVCREFLNGSDPLCPPCEAEWPKAESRRVLAAGLYKGILHDLVVRMKYGKEERLAAYLGRRMADEIVGAGSSRPYDFIVPIPLHIDRLRERGFNQALLLAREIGKVLDVEVDPFLMVKKRPTPPQAALTSEERRKNLKGVFDLKKGASVKDKRILLVDDVYTTGTTIEEASKILLSAGAEEVETVVLARAE